MKKLIALCFLLVQLGYGMDIEWSKTGHRTIGEVAQQHLSGKAKGLKETFKWAKSGFGLELRR